MGNANADTFIVNIINLLHIIIQPVDVRMRDVVVLILSIITNNR